jgi:hypothetical protein
MREVEKGKGKAWASAKAKMAEETGVADRKHAQDHLFGPSVGDLEPTRWRTTKAMRTEVQE